MLGVVNYILAFVASFFLFIVVIVLALLLAAFLILIPVLITSKGVVTNNELRIYVGIALVLVIATLIT